MLLYLSSQFDYIYITICRSGGMADASDSKSDVGDNVWVRVPPSAPNKNKTNLDEKSKFVLFFYKRLFPLDC